MDLFLLTLLGVAHIGYVRHGGDDVHIELTVQALLYNLHVEQAQESATKTEAQGNRGLWGESQRSIVQLQLLQRGTQVLIVRRVDGIDTRKHHRLDFLEALDSRGTGILDVGDGIAHLHLLGILDA